MNSTLSAVAPPSASIDVQEVLLFDHVYMMNLDQVINELSDDYLQANLAYLREREFVRPAPGTVGDLYEFLGKLHHPFMLPDGDRGGNMMAGVIPAYGTTLGWKLAFNAAFDQYFLLEDVRFQHIRLPAIAARMISMVKAEMDPWSYYCVCGIDALDNVHPRPFLGQIPARIDRFYPASGEGEHFVIDLVDHKSAAIVWVKGRARGVEFDFVWRDGVNRYEPIPDADEQEKLTTKDDDYLEVILQAVPLPVGDIPYDELFEIKAQLADKLQRLHLWIWKIFSEGQYTPQRLRRDILEMTGAYEEELRALRVEYRWGPIRTALSLPFDIVQGLTRLKLRDALDAIHSAQLRRSKLLHGERTASGCEIAYLSSLAEDDRLRRR